MNFKFCTHIHRIDRNKSPLKISAKVAVGVLRDSRKFSGHVSIYTVHCAVIFAVAQLSCNSTVLVHERTVICVFEFLGVTSVREYVFYGFFFRFQKKHDFLRFFEMTFQKKVKSHIKVSSLLNVYRNFGLKTPGCYGYL